MRCLHCGHLNMVGARWCVVCSKSFRSTTVDNTTRMTAKQIESSIYIGRPGEWGNPYQIGKHGNRKEVVRRYRVFLRSRPDLVARVRVELKGKVLRCWCAPKACHGDVLAEVAEGGEP